MKNIIKKITLLLMLTVISSCVDQDFDEPPLNGSDPAGVTANWTIMALRDSFYQAGQATALPANAIIQGIVVSNDEQGNFYKGIVIQDATGGILIRVDRTDTYALMPVGRRLFIKCGGLFISDYGDLAQIGVLNGNGVERIPDLLIDQYLLRGQWGLPVPLEVTDAISSLDNQLDQNKLFRLDNVTFAEGGGCTPWSEPTTTTNRTLTDSHGESIVVRTSNFSTFAPNYIPGGTGSVVGVFQNYNSTKQFIIRDLRDVIGFSPASCVAFTTPVHTILDLSTKYQGSDRTIPAGSDIEGIVISDLSNLNITANNVVIQDATGGIVVRFNTANPYTLGQKVHFNISNQTLTSYNGLVEVLGVDGSTGLDISLSTVTGTGTITPRIATLQDIVANKDLWESTLVQISGVTISGAGTYSGNTTLTDATGTLPMYTRTSSTFSAIAYPTTPVTITGIVSDFNAAQLNIRNANDVQP